MAEYEVTAPDGRVFRVTAPDSATQAEVLNYARQNVPEEKPEDTAYRKSGLGDISPSGMMANDDDIMRAQTIISQAPVEQQPILRNKWARDYVNKARGKADESTFGSFVKGVDDRLRQFSDYVPIVGAYTDEANAWINSQLGESDYDTELALARARRSAAHEGDKEPLFETPLGDVYTSGLTKTAGAVTGSLAAPFAKAFQSGKPLAEAGNAALTGAIYGSAEGFGQGEGGAENRLDTALETGALGGVLGGALGGTVAKLTGGKGAPTIAREAEQAADDLGISMPRAMATGDSIPGQSMRASAAGLREIPVIGAPVASAVERTSGQISDVMERISRDFAQGRSVSPADAGQVVKEGMTDWIKGRSSDISGYLYDRVRSMVPASARYPVSNTENMLKILAAEDTASATATNAPIVKILEEAVSRNPLGGLTFDGMMKLRTSIGSRLNDAMLPDAGTIKPGLKRVYGALTDDLEAMVKNRGSDKAYKAWNNANKLHRQIVKRREDLEKIIGKTGQNAPEGIVDRLIRFASTKSSADTGRLLQARKALGNDAWGDLASVTINRLGRNQSNKFSIPIFLKNYNQLSKNGRDILLGKSGLRGELDKLTKVMDRVQEFEKLRNTSGTARAVAVNDFLRSFVRYGTEYGFKFATPGLLFSGAFMPAFLTGAGGFGLSTILARPHTARPLRRIVESVLDRLEGRVSKKSAMAAIKLSASVLAKELSSDLNQSRRDLETQILDQYRKTLP